MPKRSLVLSLPLVFGVAGLFAGEEYMPLHPGDYAVSESGIGLTVAPLRTVSSIQSGRPEEPALRRNMVRLQLPSLGSPKSESKLRLVGARESSVDGSLEFDAGAAAPYMDAALIPGLVPPEILAMDSYNLAEPEPARTGGSGHNAPPEAPAPYFPLAYTSDFVAIDRPPPITEQPFDMKDLDVLPLEETAAGRLDSLSGENEIAAAFQPLELPYPLPEPERPEPLARSASLTPPPGLVSAPPALRPPAETRMVEHPPASLRPDDVMPLLSVSVPESAPKVVEAASAPGPAPLAAPELPGINLPLPPLEDYATYDVPAVDPLPPPAARMPAPSPVEERREMAPAPPAASSGRRRNAPLRERGRSRRRAEVRGITPIRELKNVLDPIFRADGEQGIFAHE